ncbi:MAG: 50S ribosomal protein L9, partial [Acidimicrobiaceae bacterium]|nr:50S ribosomal protein L9 [Acidimicrobiaceae bacterium]
EAVARTLVPQVIRIPMRAGGDDRLFGSVTSSDVASAVAEQTGVELDRRKLNLEEPIKSLGTHEVPVKLHSDVEFRVTVDVVRA